MAEELLTLRDQAERRARRLGLDAPSEFKDPSPVSLFVEEMIRQAVRRGASDIHIFPAEPVARLAFLVDGHLQPACTLSTQLFKMVRARLKILADLDIMEKQRPQFGRIEEGRLPDSDDAVIRVRTLPTGAPLELLIVSIRREPNHGVVT